MLGVVTLTRVSAPAWDLPWGGDLRQGACPLHRCNTDGGRATCRSMVELPRGAIHPRVLRQRPWVEGAFDFQEGDAALVGGEHDESPVGW